MVVPVLRWLLPLVAALALTGQAVVTFAAAGVDAVMLCCCPDPERCTCDDHDGDRDEGDHLTRCSVLGELTVPIVPVAALAAPVVATPPEVAAVAWPPPRPLPASRSIEVEPPPF